MQKTILVVEDDANLRISLRKILAANNFKVLEAENGAEALERVEKERPDLVLLDFGLPVVSGETVCVRIKEEYPDIIVIAVTEKTMSSDVIHGLRIGADDYVSKPFVVEELLARINTRLKTRNHDHASPENLEMSDNKLILRESIVLVVLRLFAAEVVFAVIFVFTSVVFSFLGTFLQLIDTVGLNFLVMTALLILNLLVVGFVVLKWKSEYTELMRDSLIRHSGILFRKEQKYACNFVEVITVEQSLLGMLFDYGTIELYDPAVKEPVLLMNIAHPKKQRKIIEKRIIKMRNQPMPFIA